MKQRREKINMPYMACKPHRQGERSASQTGRIRRDSHPAKHHVAFKPARFEKFLPKLKFSLEGDGVLRGAIDLSGEVLIFPSYIERANISDKIGNKKGDDHSC
jgi:hypothetical protein